VGRFQKIRKIRLIWGLSYENSEKGEVGIPTTVTSTHVSTAFEDAIGLIDSLESDQASQ
jgi:hypothetical protein